MKRTLLAIAALCAAVGVLAQGTVNFATDGYTLGDARPITDVDGTTPLFGDAFLGQLYAGADAASLAPIGDAVAFLDDFGDALLAGVVSGGTRSIASVAPGADAVVEVRAWQASDGGTYEAAEAAGGKVGKSAQFTVTTGGAGSPPSLPANLTGFASFSLVPEPSTAALGLLGAAALLLRRRK